jgi:Leucine Rich repeats (2 copies)
MRVRIDSTWLTAAIGIAGAGIALMYPDAAIALFILAGLVFLFGIRIEGWHFHVGDSWRNRMSTWGPWILIVGGPVLGLIWLYLIPSQEGIQASASTVARLTELGWTVKPGESDILFEVVDRSLPPMKESASYFAQLHKPFRLHFQQVKGLEGLHYLADIKDCTRIEINAGEFTDISQLHGFGHLTSLIISQVPLNGVGIVDAAALSSMSNLEELNLNHTRIRSSDFLVSLPKLKALNLGQTLISDISPISGLNLLEKLEIRDTRVADLRPLKQAKNLKELSISGPQVPGLTDIAKLENLKTLKVIEQKNIDLSPVGSVRSLESLFVWGLPHFDLLALHGLANLQTLQLSGIGFGTLSSVANLQAIGDLKELRTLTLGQLQIGDLNFAQELKNVTEINLSQLPILSLVPLRNLTFLKKISLRVCPKTSGGITKFSEHEAD